MSLQDSTFNTTHVMDNEIIKANDFEFAFENLVTNVSKATQMFLESTQDFVINGKVTPETGMRVEIAPIFGVCKSTGIPFGRTESEIMEYSFETSPSGRIDIIEVKGDWETYDEQQRAFNDPDTDTQTYQYVKTKKLMKPVYQIKQGTEGGSVAPEVDDGWVKLAEVVIRANANSLLEDDIKNITSDVAGEDNDDWTTETDITYNIGYISDVNARFRVQHNADGTHKANVINAVSLDIGTGVNQINGNILPVGGSVSIPTETIAATDSILSVFVKAASMLTSLHGAYLKYGNYGFKGVLSISSLVNDGTDVLKKPISISAAGDGTAVIKIDNAAVLSIDANGKLSTNGYVPTSNNHLITKSVTDAINTALTALTNRVTALESASDTTTATNEVLSSGTDGRYNPDTTFIYAATTENITLSGTQTIDGEILTDGDLILVKNQTDAKENGIYSYASNSAWSRALAFDTPTEIQGKLFSVSNGTVNKDKMFYVTQTDFSDPNNFGTDDIPVKEYFGSIKPLANKLVMRDKNGKIADIQALYTNADPSNPAETPSAGSCTTFARSDHVHGFPFVADPGILNIFECIKCCNLITFYNAASWSKDVCHCYSCNSNVTCVITNNDIMTNVGTRPRLYILQQVTGSTSRPTFTLTNQSDYSISFTRACYKCISYCQCTGPGSMVKCYCCVGGSATNDVPPGCSCSWQIPNISGGLCCCTFISAFLSANLLFLPDWCCTPIKETNLRVVGIFNYTPNVREITPRD